MGWVDHQVVGSNATCGSCCCYVRGTEFVYSIPHTYVLLRTSSLSRLLTLLSGVTAKSINQSDKTSEEEILAELAELAGGQIGVGVDEDAETTELTVGSVLSGSGAMAAAHTTAGAGALDEGGAMVEAA